MNPIDIMLIYAFMLIKTPYIWASNSPLRGVDCSAFALEVMRSVNIIDRQDRSSQMIHDFIIKDHREWQSAVKKGSILFFGKDTDKITHIAIALNKYSMIGASGGDRGTKTFHDAIRKNAMVKITPIRKDLVASYYPAFLKGD